MDRDPRSIWTKFINTRNYPQAVRELSGYACYDAYLCEGLNLDRDRAVLAEQHSVADNNSSICPKNTYTQAYFNYKVVNTTGNNRVILDIATSILMGGRYSPRFYRQVDKDQCHAWEFFINEPMAARHSPPRLSSSAPWLLCRSARSGEATSRTFRSS